MSGLETCKTVELDLPANRGNGVLRLGNMEPPDEPWVDLRPYLRVTWAALLGQPLLYILKERLTPRFGDPSATGLDRVLHQDTWLYGPTPSGA